MALFGTTPKQSKQDKLMQEIQDEIQKMRELVKNSSSNVVILRKDQTDDTIVSKLTVITSNMLVGQNGTYSICH